MVSQGGTIWTKCYHGTRYPVSTFIHLDDIAETSQNASSLANEQGFNNYTIINHGKENPGSKNTSTPIRSQRSPESTFTELPSLSVGHISHIPRSPPTPQTYTIPRCPNAESNALFGMISLKEDDVCYTSGTIEWVGRNNNSIINSGFKVLQGKRRQNIEEPVQKKAKFDSTFSHPLPNFMEKIKNCDCADILPTVNAIVDHLNALHEAVDIVDLRLNNLEDVVNEQDM